MKKLDADEMVMVGAGPCGGTLSSMFLEGTSALAGAFIGWGVTALNPIGAYYGAVAGFTAGTLVCRD